MPSINGGPTVAAAMGAILGLLACATVAAVAARRLWPLRFPAEIGPRLTGWWIMIAGLFAALALSRTAAIWLFAFVSYLALKEFLSLIPTRRADRHVLFWAYLSIPIQYFLIQVDWYGMFVLFIPVYMFLLLPMRMISIGETQGFLRAVGTTHWGLMTMVFCLSHVCYLLVLGGEAMMLFLILITQANDIAQYVWGKSFGTTKVLPTVSPNKTWVGLVGGVATTAVLGLLIGPRLTPMTPLESLGIGLALGFFGFCGDATMAALKRDLGIKDFSAAIPGHGGMVDRVNSLIFTAPLFTHYIRYYYT
ncbi:MAG: phosphatidate cytidylyltransferase [Lentisphaerae bacterium]|nr:phosphatidate cytidylyltransferase [Lentisphaerota bacterium]